MNPVEDVLPEDGLDAELFDTGGRWRNGLRDWEVRPDQLLQRKEFVAVLNGCIEKLPAKPAIGFLRLFCMPRMELRSI